ncbi:hypothetical protein [Candidatus Tisiphia endosymbiont of Empis tessellata]|uniref:hypothetical protein n=1 Tax=Candidatus Tisiphia endosymbiont of Empis tessellata TaxID=3066259 RepID=UPI00313BC1FA
MILIPIFKSYLECIRIPNIGVVFLSELSTDVLSDKVIVSGLRHFDKRFVPRRLFDVPVKMGWIKHPTLEKYLNPYPIFFLNEYNMTFIMDKLGGIVTRCNSVFA